MLLVSRVFQATTNYEILLRHFRDQIPVDNTENTESTDNMENTENKDNTENMENTENTDNTESAGRQRWDHGGDRMTGKRHYTRKVFHPQ